MWASCWHDDDHARSVFVDYRDRSVQSPEAYERQRLAILTSGDREAVMATIDVPTLVIHGSADTLITPAAGERTAAVIPDSEYLFISGWGHDLAPGGWDVLVPAIAAHCRRADQLTSSA